MHRPKLSRRQIKILVCVSIIAAVVIAFFYGSWLNFQTYYLGVMKDLNSSETKAYMRNKINGSHNFIELLNWTSQNLNWSEESFTRYSKPQQILNQGKGRCGEFTIVYIAACLAFGYEARIVVSRQFYQIGHGFHTWAEVKLDGVWTHVDPSPTAFWNDTSRYRSWNWGPRITLNVFAFEDGQIEDVTSRYR
ncbi:MAG: transglutaminase-like domain-containing protein [Candidatus Bathyarchaeota archaeon]|nr:transglutaminase-like domain-containing protein [Candidatus Bathyarchaeota archaeon]